MIVLIIRTRKPFLQSTPGKYLLLATILTVAATIIFPFTPLGRPFGFGRLPMSFILVMVMIVILYIIGAEMAKKTFYKKVKF
jgi:Mg2+-importing ATPase